MNKKQIKQCAIYTRVSTDLQAEKSFHLARLKKKKSGLLLKARIIGKSTKFILIRVIPELTLIALPYKNYLKI